MSSLFSKFSLLLGFGLLIITGSISQAQESRNDAFITLGQGKATALAWRPNSNMLFVGTHAGINIHNDQLELIEKFAEDWEILDLSWNENGDRLLVVQKSIELNPVKHIRIWDAVQEEFIVQLELSDPTASPFSVRWCPNNDYIAGYENGFTVLWDAQTGEQLSRFDVIPASYTSDSERNSIICILDHTPVVITEECDLVRLSDDAKEVRHRLSLGSLDCEQAQYNWSHSAQEIALTIEQDLYIFDVATGELISRANASGEAITDLVWTDQDQHIITSGTDGMIRQWNPRTGASEGILGHYSNWIQRLVLDSGRNRLVSLAGDNLVQLWDISTGSVLNEFVEYTNATSVDWSRDGERVVVRNDNTRTQVWDADTGQLIRHVASPILYDEPLAYVPYSYDWSRSSVFWNSMGTKFARLSPAAYVNVFEYGNQTPIYQLHIPGVRFSHFAWNSDGTLLAAYGEGNNQRGIWLWDINSGDLVRFLEGSDANYYSFTWSPDGSKIAFQTHGVGGWVSVLDIVTGRPIFTVLPEFWTDDPIEWTYDGTEINVEFTSGAEGSYFWDALTGVQTQSNDELGGVLQPNGPYIAIALISKNRQDIEIRIWNRETNEVHNVFSYPYSVPTNPLLWSPNGDRIVFSTVQDLIFVFDTGT